jgi:hypothetical protein
MGDTFLPANQMDLAGADSLHSGLCPRYGASFGDTNLRRIQ